MQKQKRAPKLRRKVVSLLTVALVLVPMMALIAYAGSDAANFSFSFGSAAGVDYDRAYKSDVGSSSGYYAQANVNSVGFNGGSVTMCVEKTNGTRITNMETVTSTGTVYFYYDTGSLTYNTYVDLTARVHSGIPGGCSGVWWP